MDDKAEAELKIALDKYYQSQQWPFAESSVMIFFLSFPGSAGICTLFIFRQVSQLHIPLLASELYISHK